MTSSLLSIECDRRQLINLGINRVFDSIEAEIQATTAGKFPIIGELSLGFIQEIREKVNSRLEGLVDDSLETIQAGLFEILAENLGILQDSNGDGVITLDDIQVIVNGEDIFFDLSLGGNEEFTTNLATDLALPELNLAVEEKEINFGFDYSFDLGFGIDRVAGELPQFYLDTSKTNEINWNWDSNLADLTVAGSLFDSINLDFGDKGSQFQGSLAIDLRDDDVRLRIEETPEIAAILEGMAEVRLGGDIEDTELLDIAVDWEFVGEDFSQPSLGSVTNTNITFFDDKVVESLDELFLAVVNISEVIEIGFGSFLTQLSRAILSQVESKLPLIGGLSESALGFIQDIQQAISNEKTGLSARSIIGIKAELLGIVHDELGILQDLTGEGEITTEDIIITNTDDSLGFSLLIGGETSFTPSFVEEFGDENFGIDINAAAELGLDYSFAVDFGIDKSNGAFFWDTSQEDEIQLSINSRNLDLTAEANILDVLNPSLTDAGSVIDLDLAINLIDGDNRLGLGEDFLLEASLDGETRVKLASDLVTVDLGWV